MSTDAQIQEKYSVLAPLLDERTRRLFAAMEARALGYGGVSRVARATGLSRNTIAHGLEEIGRGEPLAPGRVRRAGGGRKRATEHDPELAAALEHLVEPVTRGDPDSPLRWTTKSVRRLAAELKAQGHDASRQLVAQLLHERDYSLQANRKTREGGQHPDRNAQFEHINARVSAEIKARNPVISVDTKKKELVGNYKNSGQKWDKEGQAPEVNVHDFPSPEVPRAHPYGVYDLAHNTGFVSVGTDHDTASFAVASIRGWWCAEGRGLYPKARRLLITCDSGGSNGARLRLWKWELQALANELGFPVCVCHFPPGTSKWNKVEHRLFSFISSNWRAEPLVDYETIVNLIARTTTAKGLRVSCRLDTERYATGHKVGDEEMATIRLKQDKFHGDWNYKISPQKQACS